MPRPDNAKNDPDLLLAIRYLSTTVAKAKAVTYLKLLPYLPKQYQTYRGSAKLLGVSYQTVMNWVRKHGNEIAKTKGGEK